MLLVHRCEDDGVLVLASLGLISQSELDDAVVRETELETPRLLAGEYLAKILSLICFDFDNPERHRFSRELAILPLIRLDVHIALEPVRTLEHYDFELDMVTWHQWSGAPLNARRVVILEF